MKIGILGTSEIAYRRFLPAVLKSKFEFGGIASRNFKNAKKEWQEYECIKFNSYDELILNKNIDAVYISLLPDLHFMYAKFALENKKHVLCEKPMTMSFNDTKILCETAYKNHLTIFENYAFLYHKQIAKIKELLPKIGDMRLVRANFCFPFRRKDDFRYTKKSGGALFDCGGYVIKILSIFNMNFKLCVAKFFGDNVDIYASACFEGDDLVAQLAFGMDNFYKCELEILGQFGRIYAPRIFTAPAEFEASVLFETKDEKMDFKIKDDSFLNSINAFYDLIQQKTFLKDEILKQAKFIEEMKNANS